MTTIYDLGLLDHLFYIQLILLRLDKTKLIPFHKLSFSNNSVEDILFCLIELSSVNKVISFDLMGNNSDRELVEHPIEYFTANPNKYSEDVYNKADFLNNNEELIDKDELQVGISIKDQSKLEEDINKEISNFKVDLLDRGESDRQYYSFQLQEKSLSEILLKKSEDLKVFKFPISLSKVEDKKIDVLRTLVAMESDKKILIHKVWNKRKSWLIKAKQNNANKLQDKDDICVEVGLSEKPYSQVQAANKSQEQKILVWSKMKLDLEHVTFQYKNFGPKNIANKINNIQFRFLKLLIEKDGKEATLNDIGSHVYENGISTEDIKNKIAQVKQQLGKDLLEIDCPMNYVNEIKQMIESITGRGYKLITLTND